jgi:leucyl aminopeptidase (aminopeptidase T)
VISGNVLEDEKVMGVHLAAGISEHIGGAVGVDDFEDPAIVCTRTESTRPGARSK